MGAKTKIAWTDATWNPFRGCSRVSPGEWLEERWRAAKVEVMEALPCEHTRMTLYTCLRPVMVPSLSNDPKCPRCRALVALKGGK